MGMVPDPWPEKRPKAALGPQKALWADPVMAQDQGFAMEPGWAGSEHMSPGGSPEGDSQSGQQRGGEVGRQASL